MQRFVTDENKKWWTLGAVSVGLFMIMLDNTVVNVALPSIRSSLDMGIEGLEWVVAGYALTFAAFMLIGGKLADFLGRRLIFMIGLAVFTAASVNHFLFSSVTKRCIRSSPFPRLKLAPAKLADANGARDRSGRDPSGGSRREPSVPSRTGQVRARLVGD